MPGPSRLSPTLPGAFLGRGAGEWWLGVVIGQACGKNCIVTAREEFDHPWGEPSVTVPRLSLYLRKLRELRARGIDRVSSKDLAEMIDLNAAQIRKDFSYFGEFGTRGVGYEVPVLVDEITRCLGLDHTWNVVIVGAGLLGTALARYRGFSEQGFRLVGMFDSSARTSNCW